MLLELSDGNFTTISPEDLNLVALSRKWVLNSGGYVEGHYRGRVLLHRLICGDPAGKEVDHINRIKNDNRRDNLRIVSHLQNMQNIPRGRSGVAGVHWSQGKWIAQITVKGKVHHLGRFSSVEEAAIARKAAEEIYL